MIEVIVILTFVLLILFMQWFVVFLLFIDNTYKTKHEIKKHLIPFCYMPYFIKTIKEAYKKLK